MRLKTQISDKNVNFLKRQEGVESRHRWKDATTISDNTEHKIVLGKTVFGKTTQKLYVLNS